MFELEIPPLEGHSEEEIARAVPREALVIADALQSADVPTDTAILAHPVNSLRIVNNPIPGWYMTELAGASYHTIEHPSAEQKGAPSPLMLSEGGELIVYQREMTPADKPADGVMRHLYIPETAIATPENNLAILAAYALAVSFPRTPRTGTEAAAKPAL